MAGKKKYSARKIRSIWKNIISTGRKVWLPAELAGQRKIMQNKVTINDVNYCRKIIRPTGRCIRLLTGLVELL